MFRPSVRLAITLVLIGAGSASTSARARDAKDHHWLSDEEKSYIRVTTPPQWQLVRDYYGLPFLLLGPESKVEGTRTSLSIFPASKDHRLPSPVTLRKDEKQYRKGRLLWLKKEMGTLDSYAPFLEAKTQSGHSYTSVGFSYHLNREAFLERSYFVTCKSRLFHMKVIINLTELQATESDVYEIISNFDCG